MARRTLAPGGRLLRLATAVGVAGATGLAAACGAGTTETTCAGAPSVTGTWRYAGTQESPDRATSTGTLAVASQRCAAFEGTLDLVETDAQGRARRTAAQVSGRVIDAASLRFDAAFETGVRQHVAAVRGDSLTGSWLVTNGASVASGSFRGQRDR